MKQVIVACGSGAATSTLICERVREIAASIQVNIDIIQCSLRDISSHTDHADLIVTSMPVDYDYSIPIVSAFSFLSGIGVETTESEIIKCLKQ